eukprot:2962062-Pleurochrysis_carterae.AAC.4
MASLATDKPFAGRARPPRCHYLLCCAGAGDDIVRGSRKVARGDAPIISTDARSVTVTKIDVQ